MDSTNSNIMLSDVVVLSTDSISAEAFTFYRTNKLSGTENILSRIEGVNLVKRGAFGMEPMLRVYSSGQINTTLNGMKIYGACTDKMDPITTYIEPNNLDKVAVTQGAGGALMGSTIGGHIDLQLREAIFDCHQKPIVTVFSLYGTNNNAFNAGASVNVNGKKMAWRINSTWRHANNYRAGVQQEVLYSGYSKVNTHLNGVWQLGKNHKLLVDIIDDRGRNIGYPALTMDVSKADMQLVAFTHRKSWNHLSIENKVYYNKVVHYMDDTKRPETIIHMDMPGWSYTGGVYSQLANNVGNHSLEFRLDAHRTTTRADMVMYPVNEIPMLMQTLPGNILSNIGGAFQYSFNIGKFYQIAANYRIDGYEQYALDEMGILQWSAFGFDISKPQHNLLHNGSLGVTRNSKIGRTILKVARGSRLPTANERIGFYLYNRADGFDYLGKFDLLSEVSYQYELKHSFKFKQTNFAITVFHHMIQDYILAYVIKGYSQMTIGANGVKTYQNTDATLSGFEASINSKIYNGFVYNGNARFVYASVKGNTPMQQVPPFKLIHALRYNYRSIQLQAEQQVAAAQNRINAEFGEQATIAWTIFSMRGVYSFQRKSSTYQISLGIENIFDKYYREHLNWGGIPQQGRNLLIGINYYLN